MAQPKNDTEVAMNRVLEAERAAHAAVAECEARAAALIDAAQQQARRIHTRTDARLGQVHSRCALALSQQVEALLQQDPAGAASTALDDEMRELLTAAIARLAESLTNASTADD